MHPSAGGKKTCGCRPGFNGLRNGPSARLFKRPSQHCPHFLINIICHLSMCVTNALFFRCFTPSGPTSAHLACSCCGKIWGDSGSCRYFLATGGCVTDAFCRTISLPANDLAKRLRAAN
ncbi:unnamed protein product [Caenorhabditis auriculariae]|uniref:Uncharacterized protein n=1 Tax=Caenorhabditis auriculariae TaxID=2777116 RepID=A0A8S1GP95_9PELO|nr:unnamed protein product [Caenorhabditis auriculariae]